MESSRFYRDLSIDLRSERDKSVYFRSWGFYFLYNAIITRKKKKKKKKKKPLTSQREKLPSAILFCQQPALIITDAKSYVVSTMSG